MLLGYTFQARPSRRYEYLGRRDGRDLNLVFRAGFGFIMEPSRAAPVIIIGAGLVGPILAQALSARSIPYLIYEQDPHASHRGVGWGLTIHWALEIFKYLVPASIIQGLPDAFVDPEAVRSGEKGNFLFYDLRKGVALWKVPPSERLRLRRQSFRQLLLQNIDVQWGKADHGN